MSETSGPRTLSQRRRVLRNHTEGMMDIVKEKLAFEVDARGYHFTAYYLTQPSGDALIEITRDGKPVKSFRWPAYKIWNIAAHADDIAAGLKDEDERGLRMAGDTGLGGNVWPSE